MINRQAMSEQLRRIRAAEQRSPEDNAFYAILALTNSQFLAVLRRYQEHGQDREFGNYVKITLDDHREQR